jgi:hypothetical protein
MEGLWIIVGFVEASVDGGLELRIDRKTALEAPFEKLGEEAFDGIGPR